VTRSPLTVGTEGVTGESNTASRPHSLKSRYVYYTLLLLIIVFFGCIRYRLRAIPLERDEGEYAYGGQLILQGAPLYHYVYTVKLPGTHAAYAVMLALLGQSQGRIHLGLALVNAATIVLVFLLAARLFDSLAGIIAAATYALLSTSPSVNGFAAHATHFVVLFALGGILSLLQALESEKGRWFFYAGLLFGLAFLMKQAGACFVLWAVVYVVWSRWKRRSTLASQLALLLVGAVLPLLVTCLLIWHSGTFPKFWFWTFVYAREYATNVALADGLTFLQQGAARVMQPATWIWVAALVGVSAALWSSRARARAFFLISFLLFSFAGVSAGLYFRTHYFILLLPVASLLAGVAVSCGVEGLRNWKPSRIVSAIPVLLFVLAFAAAIDHQREFLFRMNALQACESMYWPNPFIEALEISDYLNRNASQGETLAVIGSEPEIYFYTHRRSATGYVYTYPLLEPQKYAVTMQKEMEAEIEKSRPDIIVLVANPKSWVAWSDTAPMQQLLQWIDTYLRQYYIVEGLAETSETSATTRYYWGAEARERATSSPLVVSVLRRKPL